MKINKVYGAYDLFIYPIIFIYEEYEWNLNISYKRVKTMEFKNNGSMNLKIELKCMQWIMICIAYTFVSLRLALFIVVEDFFKK